MIDSVHQSMVGMWLRCGVQFERRYIYEEIFPPGVAARRGSSFHKAAEINHKQKITSDKDLPLGDLQDAARDEYVRLVKEEGVFIPVGKQGEKDNLLTDGLSQTMWALDLYHHDIAPKIKPIGAEVKITADIGLDIPMVGTIDLVQAISVHDFKVVGQAKGQKWADRALQPSFYYELHKAEYGDYPQMFQYDEIVPLKTKTNYNPYMTLRDEADLQRMQMYIESFMMDVRTGTFRPAEPDYWICSPDWCGYYHSCPYGQLKRTIK